MRRWGLRGCEPIPRYKTCLRVMNLPDHWTPNGVWPLVGSWVYFFNRLIINRFKVVECINAGGKKGKLFCNFRFAGWLCANCKCAWPCAVAWYKLNLVSFIFYLVSCNFIVGLCINHIESCNKIVGLLNFYVESCKSLNALCNFFVGLCNFTKDICNFIGCLCKIIGGYCINQVTVCNLIVILCKF